MPLEIDKTLIKQRFAKSVATYDEHASVQKSIAHKLVSFIADRSPVKKFNRVLELGAGTGFCTRELLSCLDIHSILCNDLVAEYKPKLDAVFADHPVAEHDFIAADIENGDEIHGMYDLVVSASALQWIIDLDNLFAAYNKKMNQGAIFAFSTFGDRNMIEIREVMKSGLYYADTASLHSVVSKHFDLLLLEENEQVLYFENPSDVLRHLKYTGVNGLFKTKWTKGDMREFSEKYINMFSHGDRVALTYHPVYIIAKKK